MISLKFTATTVAAAFFALLLQGCAIHVSRLALGEPPKGETTPVTITSDKSSLSTIVGRLRDRYDAPIIVSMDSHIAANTYFTGSVTANTWPEAFEQILQKTGVTYTRKSTTVPVFDIPGQN
jgi:hypothetical protein